MENNRSEVAVTLLLEGEPHMGVLLNSSLNFIVLSVTLTVYVNSDITAFIWNTQQMKPVYSRLNIYGELFDDLCIETFGQQTHGSQNLKAFYCPNSVPSTSQRIFMDGIGLQPETINSVSECIAP